MRSRLFRVAPALAALALLALTSCGKREPIASTGAVTLLAGDALPAPSSSDTVANMAQSVLGPRDVINVEVFGIEELQRRQVRIDAAGDIAFPLAGTVRAAGLTPAEVSAVLTERLRGAGIRDPQVAVSVAEIESQMFAVSGQVNQPGLYPVLGRMSLMRAIASARGMSKYADNNEVVVFRTVEGRRLAALYDLGAIQRGNYADPEIFANDVIAVSDNKTRRLFEDILQIVPLLSTPIIVALQN